MIHLPCSYCKETNPEKFYKEKGRVRHGSSYCKACFKAYQTNRGIHRKQQAVEYKGGKCEGCGYRKCLGALQFHHTDPSQKEFQWKQLKTRNWEAVTMELDKCQLLCANCHAEVHFEGLRLDGPNA